MKNIFENIKTQTVYYPIILFKRVLIERKYLKVRICRYVPPSSLNQKNFFLNIETETVYCTIKLFKSCIN